MHGFEGRGLKSPMTFRSCPPGAIPSVLGLKDGSNEEREERERKYNESNEMYDELEKDSREGMRRAREPIQPDTSFYANGDHYSIEWITMKPMTTIPGKDKEGFVAAVSNLKDGNGAMEMPPSGYWGRFKRTNEWLIEGNDWSWKRRDWSTIEASPVRSKMNSQVPSSLIEGYMGYPPFLRDNEMMGMNNNNNNIKPIWPKNLQNTYTLPNVSIINYGGNHFLDLLQKEWDYEKSFVIYKEVPCVQRWGLLQYYNGRETYLVTIRRMERDIGKGSLTERVKRKLRTHLETFKRFEKKWISIGEYWKGDGSRIK